MILQDGIHLAAKYPAADRLQSFVVEPHGEEPLVCAGPESVQMVSHQNIRTVVFAQVHDE